MAIVWNDNLKTGISTIDEQHQLLFKTINELEELKYTQDGFYKVLLNLQDYVSVHFCTEEKYMRCLCYPEYENHKTCHEKFVADCQEILKKDKPFDKFSNIEQELINFVENWIIAHYTNEDVKMAEFVKSNHLNNNFL